MEEPIIRVVHLVYSHVALQDVFSFGVVLWELLTWEIPWAGVRTNYLVGFGQSDSVDTCMCLESLKDGPTRS
jgi:hypothetical protein